MNGSHLENVQNKIPDILVAGKIQNVHTKPGLNISFIYIVINVFNKNIQQTDTVVDLNNHRFRSLRIGTPKNHRNRNLSHRDWLESSKNVE